MTFAAADSSYLEFDYLSSESSQTANSSSNTNLTAEGTANSTSTTSGTDAAGLIDTTYSTAD